MAAGGPEDAGAGAAASAPDPFLRSDPPILALTIRPHRSLSARGGAAALGLVAAGLAAPLLSVGGGAVGWALLPFLVGALAALYVALRRNAADRGRLREELRLWPDLITVERREPDGAVRRWHANPAWVRLRLIEDAPVEKYLTLSGGGREIELGGFLSPAEREALHRDLARALAPLRAG